MYNNYINEKLNQKIEYDTFLLKEYLIIYINFLIKYPKEEGIRHELTKFLKDYYVSSLIEYQLLNKIKHLKANEKLEDECINILEELENIFERQFQYNEDILNGYEDALFFGEPLRAVVWKKDFVSIDKIKMDEYIKRLEKNKYLF